MSMSDALLWIKNSMVAVGPTIFYGLFALSIAMFVLRSNHK